MEKGTKVVWTHTPEVFRLHDDWMQATFCREAFINGQGTAFTAAEHDRMMHGHGHGVKCAQLQGMGHAVNASRFDRAVVVVGSLNARAQQQQQQQIPSPAPKHTVRNMAGVFGCVPTPNLAHDVRMSAMVADISVVICVCTHACLCVCVCVYTHTMLFAWFVHAHHVMMHSVRGSCVCMCVCVRVRVHVTTGTSMFPTKLSRSTPPTIATPTIMTGPVSSCRGYPFQKLRMIATVNMPSGFWRRAPGR